MTEADLAPLLKPLVAGKAYPYVVKLTAQGEAAVSPPWIVYSLIIESPTDVLGGQAETQTSLQVDVYAMSIDEARTLREAALGVLKPFDLTQILKMQGYETDTKLFRATFEAVNID